MKRLVAVGHSEDGELVTTHEAEVEAAEPYIDHDLLRKQRIEDELCGDDL